MHLDVVVDDIEAEAARWIALGASRRERGTGVRARRRVDRDARSRGQRDLYLRQLDATGDARFVAIRPPPRVLDAIEARLAAVAMPGGRLASRDQWHITVQFLGNDAELSAVADRVRSTSRSISARRRSALGGADALGEPATGADPRVGAERRRRVDRSSRRRSNAGSRRSAMRAGAREERFVPHLTLARFRAPHRPAAVVRRGRPRADRPRVAGRRGRALRERAVSGGRAARGPAAGCRPVAEPCSTAFAASPSETRYGVVSPRTAWRRPRPPAPHPRRAVLHRPRRAPPSYRP